MHFKTILFPTLLLLLATQGMTHGMEAIRAMETYSASNRLKRSKLDIIEYALAKDYESVHACLKRGDNVNQRDVFGQTALQKACIHKNANELVRLLLSYKADYTLRDKSGRTPMHIAANYNNVGALTLLKDAGANLNDLNDICATPCHDAALENALEAIAWLGDAGADMNAIDSWGLSPLHVAVHCEKLAVIHQLLAHGARLHVRTKKNSIEDAPESTIIPEGSTVFHLVAEPNDNSHAIQRLLLYHALFHPQGKPITPQGLLTYLCCLKKMHPALYNNRKLFLQPLIHNWINSLSPKVIVGLVQSEKDHFYSLGRDLLIHRMAYLKMIQAAQNAEGKTAYQLECHAKILQDRSEPKPKLLLAILYADHREQALLSETLYLETLYDEQLAAFIAAAKTNTIQELPDHNLVKVAYGVALEQHAQPKAAKSFAQSCIAWATSWLW